MKKISQQERVVKRLLSRNQISRNECLSTFPEISRLSAIIQDLEVEGWVFETEFSKTEKGQDYIYTVNKCPYTKVERYVPLLNKTVVTWVK